MNKIPSVSEFTLKYPEASLLTVVPKSEDNYEKKWVDFQKTWRHGAGLIPPLKLAVQS